jgi:NAD+ diphosphatase
MNLTYGDMPLDRCTNQRKNKRWLATEFKKDSTLFCVINEGMSLFEHNSDFLPVYLTRAHLESLSVTSCIYLGKGNITLNGETFVSLFAIDFNKLRFSTQEQLLSLGQWQQLRQVTPNLTATDASIQALAKGLVYWHNTHQYCGKCGNISQSVEAGHARRCTGCRNLSFPRTDPAVIMLVERMCSDGIARCLLGRQASWQAGMYSTLAGFVDPGETLEAAVIREVSEETAVNVEQPHYVTSQPWPFPASIMLGFTAVATSADIDISDDDLEDAQWFSREQLAGFGIKTRGPQVSDVDISQETEFSMSSSDSISSYLITAWKNKEIGRF